MRRICALLPLLVFPATLASQQAATSRAADLVTLARGQIRVNRADSALTLLKVAADSATGGTVGDRVQAYVLLGVLEYIAHRDSSATAPPGAPAGSPSDLAHDCVRRCRGGEIKPQLIDRPQFTMLDQSVVLGPSQTHGLIVVRFVVGVEGAPEPESIHVMTNTAQRLTNQVLDAVRALHFRPATLAGAPVRADVEMRFEFRASGTNYVDYTITGP